jgi:hypothetical protein
MRVGDVNELMKGVGAAVKFGRRITLADAVREWSAAYLV